MMPEVILPTTFCLQLRLSAMYHISIAQACSGCA